MGEAGSKNSVSNIDLAGIPIKSYLYLCAVHNDAIADRLAGMAEEPAAHKTVCSGTGAAPAAGAFNAADAAFGVTDTLRARRRGWSGLCGSTRSGSPRFRSAPSCEKSPSSFASQVLSAPAERVARSRYAGRTSVLICCSFSSSRPRYPVSTRRSRPIRSVIRTSARNSGFAMMRTVSSYMP